MNGPITAQFLNDAQSGHAQNDTPLTIVALGDRNLGVFAGLLEKSLGLLNWNGEVKASAHTQPELECTDPNGLPASNQPDFLVFAQNEEFLRGQFYGFEQKESWAQCMLDRLEGCFQSVREMSSNTVFLVENCAIIPDGVGGILALSDPSSFRAQSQKLNFLMVEWASEHSNIIIIDKTAYAAELGWSAIQNPAMKSLLSMPFTLDFEAKMSWEIARAIADRKGALKKCLVLDLDNTIWGGVIGDDGCEGIQLDPIRANGYLEIQRWAKALKERGVLLAINSKNELEVAKQPFLKHPNMLLKLDDIAVFIANWKSKDENLKTIQEQLNIGMDAIVFVDDSPAERAWIREKLPQVTVPELPADPNQYGDFIHALRLFNTSNKPTVERTEFFKQNEIRLAKSINSIDLPTFLTELKLKAKVGHDDVSKAARVSELSLRTNQFNLTGKRWTEEEVLERMKSEENCIITVDLEDRFGDYGLVGFVAVGWEGNKMSIENWCLSCRAFQRGVEELLCNLIVDCARKHKVSQIIGRYVPSEKNSIVAQLFNNFGFTSVNNTDWELNAALFEIKVHKIQVTDCIG